MAARKCARPFCSRYSLARRAQNEPDGSDILLITGEIHAIDSVLKVARRSHQRFFVVGIGASPSEGRLRRLAEATGASCEFVAPGEAVDSAVQRMYHRMRSPHIWQARIEWPSGYTVQTAGDLPKSIFAGDDVTVFAQLRAAGRQNLVVRAN